MSETYLYSVEPFPGTRASGRFHEFLEYNAISILHPGNCWVRLGTPGPEQTSNGQRKRNSGPSASPIV
jgi:hypothetical protein